MTSSYTAWAKNISFYLFFRLVKTQVYSSFLTCFIKKNSDEHSILERYQLSYLAHCCFLIITGCTIISYDSYRPLIQCMPQLHNKSAYILIVLRLIQNGSLIMLLSKTSAPFHYCIDYTRTERQMTYYYISYRTLNGPPSI